MWLLFRHSPKLDLAKVVAWLFLPVIYFALPAVLFLSFLQIELMIKGSLL